MGKTGIKQSILLLGATGLVGGECLNLLLVDDHFSKVVTLTRRSLSTDPADPRHVHHVTALNEA